MSELKTNLQSILQEKTTKLIPENIKRKVEIFDVTGTDGDAEVEELQAKIIETKQEIADTRRDLENSAATVTGTGENVTLNQTAEATLKKLGVGGNSKQAQYTGKNLAKVSGSASINLLGSISVNKDSNDIIINGTATGDVASQKAFVLDGDAHGNYATYITPSNTISLTAGTYVLTIDNITGSYSGVSSFWIRLVKKTESQPYTAIASLVLPSTSISFNIEEDGEYFISPNFSYTSETSVTFNNYKFNIMLASGSDTSYEPYVGGTASPNPDYPQEITNVTGDVEVKVQNKNLVKITNLSSKIYANGLPTSDSSSIFVESYDANNIKFYSNYNNFNIVLSNIIQLKPNTQYTIKFDRESTSTNNQWFIYNYDNGYSINFRDNNTNIFEKTFTTNSLGKIALAFGHGNTTGTTTISNIQIEKNTTATPYTPHKEQVFTFPLGNEKLMLGDYLADDGIHHVRGQIVIDGSETWNDFSYTDGDNNFRVQKNEKLPNILTPPTNPANLICNYFKPVNRDSAYVKTVVGIAQYGLKLGTIFISAPISILQNQTLQGWKDWLAEHNLIVEYLLAEEEVVPYTSAQQEVYDAMKKAISYEEQTNVSSSDTTSPIFTVTAFRDADLAIASLDNQLTLKE